jgi:hypothetical protein
MLSQKPTEQHMLCAGANHTYIWRGNLGKLCCSRFTRDLARVPGGRETSHFSRRTFIQRPCTSRIISRKVFLAFLHERANKWIFLLWRRTSLLSTLCLCLPPQAAWRRKCDMALFTLSRPKQFFSCINTLEDTALADGPLKTS